MINYHHIIFKFMLKLMFTFILSFKFMCYELLRLSLYRLEVGSQSKSSSKEIWIQGLDILAAFLV